jgi:hypothetical protein
MQLGTSTITSPSLAREEEDRTIGDCVIVRVAYQLTHPAVVLIALFEKERRHQNWRITTFIHRRSRKLCCNSLQDWTRWKQKEFLQRQRLVPHVKAPPQFLFLCQDAHGQRAGINPSHQSKLLVLIQTRTNEPRTRTPCIRYNWRITFSTNKTVVLQLQGVQLQ